jgi:predicted RNA-binding Zn ribbon-like protein
MVHREIVPHPAIEPINEVLQITEGHDELVHENARWRLEFVAREDSMEWLLAAVARSAAEIIVEGLAAPLRVCSNSGCGLFFYDTSRTHRRRWCSMARCGNRHKVATFSRRHSAVRREH